MKRPAPNEALRQARIAAGFKSAQSAAEHYRWPVSTYRAHENGTREFPPESAVRYAKAFGVPHDTLLDDDAKRTLARHIINLPNAVPEREIQPQRKDARRLPVVGRAVGANIGADEVLEITEEPVDQVSCPESLENVPGAYAVRVVGSSMEPRYFAGELLYVHPWRPPSRGSWVLVQVKNPAGHHLLGYVKQFISMTPTRLILRQLNPDMEIEFERSDVEVIHRIVGSAEG